jgi:hypothetical protein
MDMGTATAAAAPLITQHLAFPERSRSRAEAGPPAVGRLWRQRLRLDDFSLRKGSPWRGYPDHPTRRHANRRRDPNPCHFRPCRPLANRHRVLRLPGKGTIDYSPGVQPMANPARGQAGKASGAVLWTSSSEEGVTNGKHVAPDERVRSLEARAGARPAERQYVRVAPRAHGRELKGALASFHGTACCSTAGNREEQPAGADRTSGVTLEIDGLGVIKLPESSRLFPHKSVGTRMRRSREHRAGLYYCYA